MNRLEAVSARAHRAASRPSALLRRSRFRLSLPPRTDKRSVSHMLTRASFSNRSTSSQAISRRSEPSSARHIFRSGSSERMQALSNRSVSVPRTASVTVPSNKCSRFFMFPTPMPVFSPPPPAPVWPAPGSSFPFQRWTDRPRVCSGEGIRR